jgi:hypothetical protein
VELLHQAPDIFQVHDDRRIAMEKAHVDALCTFCVATLVIGLKDDLEIGSVCVVTLRP